MPKNKPNLLSLQVRIVKCCNLWHIEIKGPDGWALLLFRKTKRGAIWKFVYWAADRGIKYEWIDNKDEIS